LTKENGTGQSTTSDLSFFSQRRTTEQQKRSGVPDACSLRSLSSLHSLSALNRLNSEYGILAGVRDHVSFAPVNNMSTTEGVVIDESAQKPELTASVAEIRQMLRVIEQDILPVTNRGVAEGNKVFGAAVLDQDLNTVLAGTNNETECPLFHGEVKVIYEWSKIIPASERGARALSSVFLATHEPCCMCVSSILWSGFPTIYYFFPYSITSAQGIPHDINTMHELWGVNSYRKRNKYFSSACLIDLIEELNESVPEKKELQETVARLIETYDTLSQKYHTEKASNPNNSLVLD
jgi:tRNA(Arg) A34 adenosine deaminase TadA